MHYDYLVVGAGLFGAAFAQQMRESGKTVLVIDKRSHIGGNAFTEEVEGIQVHRYQGIPIGGYTRMIGRMLEGVEVRLNEDYLSGRDAWNALADRVVYTGSIDSYFGYCYGHLSYRSVRFETEVLDTPNFQGNAVVNYTDRKTPYTRIIEHKFFEFGTQPKTVISREYSSEWQPGGEPYYPINDEANTALYQRYRALAAAEKKTVFGGRLGEYRYYDMDAVLLRALETAEQEKRREVALG